MMCINNLKETVSKETKAYLGNNFHPCVLVKSFMESIPHDTNQINIYNDMHSIASQIQLMNDLASYISNVESLPAYKYSSFLAVFPNDVATSDLSLEHMLWQLFQELHELDDQPWDSTVSADVNSIKNSYCLLGKTFYITGMHPRSLKNVRKAPYTTVVFNLHDQTEQLRLMASYKMVEDKMRKRNQERNTSFHTILSESGLHRSGLPSTDIQTKSNSSCQNAFSKKLPKAS